ncbi:hypothetical protein CD30_06795 [Ureibacillus massiliensis 4400831 = CIP 108448 = CCUG 49529]|uniref:Auxin efflux carrier n=1 Tax=Ureibacillus massiliensis 4400831 = CIP 108448 = CCUG 49529 TaxID=1211035 RepID=A0A0A3J6J8_9BACL|nr:AEC family transporter [Ureibacillus massiliensis]KGR91325.1 hypothetical protein CD30_06795 [Ureibacillus massiliensis 4400831 = CIP 108448 = CCUG 49529]
MGSISLLLQELLMLYGIAILGFIARRRGILNENANNVLTQLILYITLPALILFSLDVSFSFSLVKEFFWLVLMSIYVLVLSILLANWMRRNAKLSTKQASVYEGMIIFGNQGFIGYAVIYILFGDQGIIYLTIFNICYLLLIWSYGMYLFCKSNDAIKRKDLFLNPGIISTIVGLVIFILPPISWPNMISDGLEMVGKMTVPLSMIIIGSLIANIKSVSLFSMLKNRALWKIAIAKLIMIPLLLIPFIVISVPTPLLLIAVIVSGMPSAPTISLYAQKYGADTSFASLAVLLTTLLCIVTIPFLYWVVEFLTH